DGTIQAVKDMKDEQPEPVEVRWDKGKVLWRKKTYSLVIDPGTATATHNEEKLDVPTKADEKVMTYTFADGKSRLCVFQSPEKFLGGVRVKHFHRVELHAPGQKPVTVVEKAEGELPVGALSPDGTMVTIVAGGKLLIVNAKGEVVGSLPEPKQK